ncbi:MAG: baseplate J/gp47 family protein, partial [Chitinophagaceae bacterium]
DVLSDNALQVMLSVRKDLPPHLALMLAFLQAYRVAVNDLNTLTKKRLDYYYEEVLRLQRVKPQPDEVHVLFELAKNAKPTLVKANALLDGGKTTTGLPLQYALSNDIVVNHAVVGMIRSSFKQFKTGGKSIILKAGDAAKILNETSTAWRPFGTNHPLPTDQAEPVQFGWAIASPNLLLAEGARKVIVELQLSAPVGVLPPATPLTSSIEVSLTSEKEWISKDLLITADLTPPAVPDPLTENLYKLKVTATINETLPAITAYNEAIHLASYPSTWPVMRMLLKPESGMIDLLSPFRVNNVSIEVEAKGVKQLILQNDQAVQAVDSPILPFGGVPLIKANFYIGSQEIFSKTLTSIGVNLEWQDPPESFSDHYKNYGNNNIVNNSFTTSVELLSNKNWNVKLINKISLFNTANPLQVQSIAVSKSDFAFQTADAPFKRNATLELDDSFDSRLKQGFLRLVLAGPTKIDVANLPEEAPFEAFGHKTYPFVYTQQVLALSQYRGMGTKPELPLQPYTPTLKSVTVDYTAKDTFIPSSPNLIEQYFIQDVFGPGEIEKGDTALLVPTQPGNGSLYIGLQNALSPQTISFLFQVEEGSVEGQELLRSSDLNWSYLAGNHWIDIAPADVLEESTGGLQKPGLIRVNMGSNATEVHSLMPKAMRWLRVSVDENTDGASSVSKIFTQAAKAKLALPAGNIAGYEKHLAAPLAAETISKLVTRMPAIKKILQPFASFGGNNIESDQAFYRRASERLRHRNRGVSGWDYERLVLEAFPQIYKIKCLPHSGKEEWFKPGDVRLVVVPDWRKRPTGDPLQPKVNQNSLREIADFVSANYVSPFVNVNVSNPSYETLLVDCKVMFHPEFDPGYYSIILEEEIKKFLSPWAYEEGQDIVFGGKVYASEILAFIEGRDYIDFVTDFELYHRYEGTVAGGIGEMEIAFDFIIGDSPDASISDSSGLGGKTINIDFVVGSPVEVALATRPDTILVSNASHRIQAMQAGMTNCQGIHTIGIGEMIIGLDFIPIS